MLDCYYPEVIIVIGCQIPFFVWAEPLVTNKLRFRERQAMLTIHQIPFNALVYKKTVTCR